MAATSDRHSNMIIHIEICDVCKRINRGGLPVVLCATVDHQWDVGACCRAKRFVVVKHTDATKSHLLARIEALITTELSLMKGPV